MGADVSSLRPDRTVLLDAGFLLALGGVATLGFAETYAGWSFFGAAMTGWLLGMLLAHVGNALGKPVIVVAAFTVVAFFLLGGAVALNSEGVSALLPLPDTLRELSHQTVHGWKDLLTTLAPVDGGPLLTLPYLMGLIAGAGGMSLAFRARSPYWVVLVPLAYLAGVILLGVKSPERVVLLGGVFAVLAVGWTVVRARRLRTRRLVGGLRLQRKAIGLVMVAAAGLVATVVGPRLPFVESHDRLVLRTYVAPPFDVGQYPSPLASFRKYTKGFRVKEKDQYLYDKPIMTVKGLPAGTRLRFAALDSYNGTVWGAANQAPGTTGPDGSFQRVGSIIRDQYTGPTMHATVTIGDDYSGNVWLPTAGHLSEIHFSDSEKAEEEQFRYNLATSTGVVPQGLSAGDTYTFTAHLPAKDVDDTTQASSDSAASVDAGLDFVPVANRWGGGAQTSMQQVLAIAQFLKSEGTYTDGEAPFQQYTAGHSTARLAKFSAEGQQIAGDDEQYAGILAVVANQVGVPTRVVVGAVVPEDGVVKGSDVHAWLEVEDADSNWRALPTDAFMSTDREPQNHPPVPQQLVSGKVVPPPAPVHPPATTGDPFSDSDARKGTTKPPTKGPALPGWLGKVATYVAIPLGLLVLLLGSVIALKTRRRRRRRTRGGPATRLSAAWRDLLDTARDLGLSVHAQRTRREQAQVIGSDGVTGLARRADVEVFGPTEPSDETADRYWSEVDSVRKQLASGVPFWKRVRASVSLASFRSLAKAEPNT